MRKNFISQLQHKKVMLDQKEKPTNAQTCVIFDWDDTLICTSFLAPH
jgi:hypothetical protein